MSVAPLLIVIFAQVIEPLFGEVTAPDPVVAISTLSVAVGAMPPTQVVLVVQVPPVAVLTIGVLGVAVALKVKGDPVSVPLVAVKVFYPAAPRVQLPTVEISLALVSAGDPVTEPPPEAIVKSTDTLPTGFA